MSHLTVIRYKPRTSRTQLQSLTRKLTDIGCRVQQDPLWTQLYVEVPTDLTTWLITGGMNSLLDAYKEVVIWSKGFTEKPDRETMEDTLP